MNIGFDLDRIFIDTPPFIPDWVIDKLNKEKDNGVLLYRVPGNLEQKVRQISHTRYFRPAIKENIDFLKNLAKTRKYTIFLISGRYGFLQKQTEKIMKAYGLSSLFENIYFNVHNEQPHVFKNRILQEKKIDLFIDDDLSLLKHLAKDNISKLFIWLNNKKQQKMTTNIQAITNLPQMLSYANK